MLQKMGCHVDLAENGASAVNAMRKAPYDLVLMDLLMPEVDGLEAARQIRSMDWPARSVPIVALTASVSAEVRACCLEAGMNDVLSKPIELSWLRRTLDAWCLRTVTAS